MASWEQLAVQIPLVAAFIWFVLEMDKRNANYAQSRDEQWREFLSKQSDAYTNSLKEITLSVERLAEKLDVHDKFIQNSVARMEGVVENRKRRTQRTNTAKD